MQAADVMLSSNLRKGRVSRFYNAYLCPPISVDQVRIQRTSNNLGEPRRMQTWPFDQARDVSLALAATIIIYRCAVTTVQHPCLLTVDRSTHELCESSWWGAAMRRDALELARVYRFVGLGASCCDSRRWRNSWRQAGLHITLQMLRDWVSESVHII